MNMGKRYPRRKVLFMDWSEKTTNRGNPQHYYYLLGCGHVLVKGYSIQNRMDTFIVLKIQTYLDKHCSQCARDRPVDLSNVHFFFGSAGLRMLEIHGEDKKLRDYLPHDAHIQPEEKVFKHLDQVVLREHGRPTYREQGIPLAKLYSNIPFPHKGINFWWELENGYAVGFNENPSRGWSFPVKKLKDYVGVLK